MTEEERDEEEGQQIDDQEESDLVFQEKISEIGQPTLEEKVFLLVQAIQKENDLVTLKRNSVTRQHMWVKKIFEIKNHIDRKESLDPRKNFELKETFEQRKLLEIHPKMRKRKVFEITHQENHLRNKKNTKRKKACIRHVFFSNKLLQANQKQIPPMKYQYQ